LKDNAYWFGLYKETATPLGTTRWYDGNPSSYRNWARGEPNDPTICVRYSKDGFEDRACDRLYYYTCKQRAGSVLLQTLIYTLMSSSSVRIVGLSIDKIICAAYRPKNWQFRGYR